MTGSNTFKHIKKGLLVFMLSLPITLLAQNSLFQAMVSNNTVAEGQKFRIEFRLITSGSNFTPPNFKGFRIISGPQQSQSTQIINGNMSSSVSFSYVLMALKEGSYVIEPASIKSAGNTYQSNEVAITVTKGRPPDQQNNEGPDIGNNVFIKALVSKTSPYVGEQMTVTYKLYYNLGILNSEITLIPSLNGFWSEDLEFENTGRDVEVVSGVRYNTATLKKTIVVPQRAGELVVDEFGMDLIIRQAVQSRSRGFFDQIMGSYKQVPVNVVSDPIKINVKALPSGKPDGFNGAVGEFKVDFEADRSEVKSNEAINFTYKISGKGNLKLLDEPNIEFPSDFEVYDPKLKENISVTSSGMSGSREYSFLAIPRHKGQFTVEPESFSYFDTRRKEYVTLRPNSISFNVAKGEDDASAAVNFSGSSKEEIKLLGSDIRFIKTDTILSPVGYGFFGSLWHYLLWILPLPLFLLTLFIKRKSDERRSDVVYMKKSKANRMAEKRLSVAKKYISDGDDKKFYEEIFKALYGFFSDKFNIPTSEINKDKISETLSSSGIDSQMTQRAIEILNKCEMARFAPVSEVSHEEVYSESVNVLSELQKGLK